MKKEEETLRRGEDETRKQGGSGSWIWVMVAAFAAPAAIVCVALLMTIWQLWARRIVGL